ncbi:MAG TPA: peptidylprolyl isomerase [Sunxiuqinia sp.]|nr:peptidylprolyl isomerase [Sunxiuqinia sp.]
MRKIAHITLVVLFSLFLMNCSSSKKKEATKSSSEKTVTAQKKAASGPSFTDFIPAIVKVETYDKERFLNSEIGFFVGKQEVVCRLSELENANEAKITPINENKTYEVTGFTAVDRINNLVLLKVKGTERKPLNLYSGIATVNTKSIYLTKPHSNTLPLHRGKVLDFITFEGVKRYTVSNQFYSKGFGTPVFTDKGQCIGLGYSDMVNYENQGLVIPSIFISAMLDKQSKVPKKLEDLKTKTSKAVSEANSKIKGLLIQTDYGNIRIRLFNETPAYRDNFIRLVRENFYDSLLIHRVIKGFGIQTGAADTRYADPDDVVGWKGPGYTLPAHIVPNFFHKRGMIGSPRKPDRRNSKRRSDGSQFYIVTGRTYSDAELNDIEKENHYHFSPEQRKVYKTIGGAPHLDGTYTIFGEVVSGMDVADKIVQVPVDSDYRPLKDIRVQKITIIK